MGDREGEETRYRAFLSYSHKDAAAAGRLHRRLEAYRIPRRLVGRETNRGPVPHRLWPIFRDREELPAATDLSETVREALAQSGALIILCSPDAAGSLWVAEEIRVFRELHPARPILAAILEGDPPDCFPDLLRAQGDGHEPLATDLRRERDGERLGLLKLVAGITGLGLDDLVQRDASRRVRRVMAVTAGAVVAMLMMAVLVAVALQARWQAERQRTEAEGLVEFMLTDLRERLRAGSNLAIMTAVNRRALSYYSGQQELEQLPAESLERRARVLLAMGEDDKERGNLPAAIAAFREAHRITAEQLARTPDDPERIYAHAQSEYWVGSIDELRGNYAAAMASYRRYRELAGRMDQLAPGHSRYIGELAYSESNLGIVNLVGFRRPLAARQHFSASLDFFRRASGLDRSNLTWRTQIADAHAWIADTWFAERRYREARAERDEERGLKVALLREDPSNRTYILALTGADRALARIDEAEGRYREAAERLEAVSATMRGLLQLDPANLTWRDHATRTEADLADLFLLRRLPRQAAAALHSASRLLVESDRLSSARSALREQLRARLSSIQSNLNTLTGRR